MEPRGWENGRRKWRLLAGCCCCCLAGRLDVVMAVFALALGRLVVGPLSCNGRTGKALNEMDYYNEEPAGKERLSRAAAEETRRRGDGL